MLNVKMNAAVACLSLAAMSVPAAAQDSALLKRFDTFARFSTSSYCTHLVDGSAQSTVCSFKDRATCAELSDATSLIEFTSNNTVSGNIAVSNSSKLIVVSLRGTDVTSFRDVMSDLKFCKRKPKNIFGDAFRGSIRALCGMLPSSPDDVKDPILPLCTGCEVATGFWNAFQGIKVDMMRVVKEQKNKHPDFSVVATGHSLGGAVATLAGAYLRKSGINTDIYTFGSPRVGDEPFATFVSNQPNGKTFRITNGADPITVAPGLMAGYAHTTPEFWFPDGLNKPSTMKVCVGVANKTCSAQFLFNLFKLDDHDGRKYSRGFDACAANKRSSSLSMPDVVTKPESDEWMRVGVLDNSTVPITNETLPVTKR
ncbi:hypothetical protein QQS21_009303 [Conoideocrella luteorostrata]|uniref:Fungal lipase-type domain-containing protein n=1 Tax=Conoideocrella luteorostrata TaxID=1105319 RepID=A0AAJ0CHF2_9HYPO|nr:hypothetical protein QQS21_009303 [Conoideocrella luteorostrata]